MDADGQITSHAHLTADRMPQRGERFRGNGCRSPPEYPSIGRAIRHASGGRNETGARARASHPWRQDRDEEAGARDEPGRQLEPPAGAAAGVSRPSTPPSQRWPPWPPWHSLGFSPSWRRPREPRQLRRCGSASPTPSGPRSSSGFVDEKGRVDYEALARDRAGLDAWLGRLVRQGPKSTPALFPQRNDKLAYYVNAYNALVFQGVLSRGPEKESVWKGGLVSGYSFFVAMKVRLDGETWSLKALEDDLIRKDFADPRIHAALNCASIGCPRLPREAFVPEKLDAQLDAAMREFVDDERNRRGRPRLGRP
ncbi:MAG: DUF547 domain-containing protein [Anaerotruncus sp.]|nr:DUF547 domain-containing protein [Anaerotruncus sp.]